MEWLRFTDVERFYGARQVLVRASGVLRDGDKIAIVGANGSGKSTLVRILTGEIPDYAGEVRLDGVVRRMADPREAIARGIAVIPQELQLVEPLSAAENIFLGREPATAGLVDARTLAARASEALSALGETHLPPGEAVEHLESGQRQLVAIARALSLDARLIIMDEPTAALGAEEAARLERLIRRLAGRGVDAVEVRAAREDAAVVAEARFRDDV